MFFRCVRSFRSSPTLPAAVMDGLNMTGARALVTLWRSENSMDRGYLPFHPNPLRTIRKCGDIANRTCSNN